MDATRALDGSFVYPNRRNFDGTPENYLEFFANAHVEDAVLHRASTAYAQAVEAALLQAWSEGENRPSDYLVNGEVAELTKQYPLEYARDEAGDMEQLPVWKASRSSWQRRSRTGTGELAVRRDYPSAGRAEGRACCAGLPVHRDSR